MYTHSDKSKERKCQAVAKSVTQMKKNSQTTFQFVDNRPETVAQRELHEMVNTSPRVTQQNSFQKQAYNTIDQNQAPIQRLKFQNHSGLFGFLSSYSEEEKKLNTLEQRAVTSFNRIHNYLDDEQYTDRIKPLYDSLRSIRSKTIPENEYEETSAALINIIDKSDAIRTEIRRRKKLNSAMGSKFNIAKEAKEEGERPHNTVTQKQFDEILNILDKIYVQDNSVISIRLESGEHFNLAQRSAGLNLNVPQSIVDLENRIRELSEREAAIDNELKDLDIANNRGRLNELRAQLDSIDIASNPLKKEYLKYVQEYVRDETMKDLTTIAQTGVGQALLKEMTNEKYKENAKVVIAVRDFYGAPTGGPSSEGGAKVSYTPQALKDRDTLNRGPGKAITRMEALKEDNPWQENERTDITLFHEMVHAFHVQDETLLGKDELVGDKEAVHLADKPFDGSGMMEGQKIGVPMEEYQTVGLGKFNKKGFNENTYRKERRDLKENVAPRNQYTHVDSQGRRVGDESAM